MTKKLLFASLLLVLLITSCGIDNTMFNARKYFKQAQDRPLTSSGRPSPQAVDEYTKTIQKCGVIITEKKGKKTLSEAVYLLARALYYKGNSAFQAKDQFEALINGFPESRHVPEAHIYLARVLRQLNRKQEAEKLLEGFVRDTRHQKSHPRALMVLAEFEIEDQDFLSAQYWLQRIITDYPKSSEFKEASFLFGKNYYEQHDYLSSYKEFEKLVNTRGINKELKLEGRYYMALNLFELGEYAKCDKLVSQLLKSESRLDKLALIRVIKARLLLQGKDEEKGINEVDEIAKSQPRSLASSAAYYYLADYYFYQNADIELAGTTYGKVRTEFPTAIYADFAKQKADAVNQIKQNKNLSAKANLQQYVDYHMLAAENYLNAFALNDSALVMYQRILDVAAPFKAELDSLTAVADSINARVDSLQIQIAELEALIPEPPPDSLESQELIPDMETEAVADSVDAMTPPDEAEEAEEDGEEISLPDLIDEPEQLSAEPDSGETSEQLAEETPEEPPLDIAQPEEEEEPILDLPEIDEEEDEPLINTPDADEEEAPEDLDLEETLEVEADEGETLTPTPIELFAESDDAPESIDIELKPFEDEEEEPEVILSLDDESDDTETDEAQDDAEPHEADIEEELGEDEEAPEIILILEDESDDTETDEAQDDAEPHEADEEEDEGAWLRELQAEINAKQDELKTLNIQQAALETKIADMQGNITRLDMEILPLVYFAKGTLLHRMQTPAETLQALQAEMEELFPANKYTNAFNLLMAGKPVRLVDPEEDRQEELLDIALGMYPDDPDSMLDILEDLTQSPYSAISLKANFRLGWFHTFDEPDTTAAKPYLDEVLNHPLGGGYADYARKFYNGNIFDFPKPKPDSIAVSDSLDIEMGDETADEEEEDAPLIEIEEESGDEQPIMQDDTQMLPIMPEDEKEDISEPMEEEESIIPIEETDASPPPEDESMDEEPEDTELSPPAEEEEAITPVEDAEEEQSVEPSEEQEETSSPEIEDPAEDEEAEEASIIQAEEADQPQPMPDGEPEIE